MTVFSVPCRVLVAGCLLSIVHGADLHGTITIVTDRSIIIQQDTGQRTMTPQTLNIELDCSTCTPGAPTYQCFPEFEACAKLFDTGIVIIGNDGNIRSQNSLDSECIPKNLQRLKSIDYELGVDCQNACFQLANVDRSTIHLSELFWYIGGSGTLVESSNPYHGSDSHVYYVELDLDQNIIIRNDPFGGGSSPIIPRTDCTGYISIFPLFTQDKFMLWCNTSTVEHLYIVDVHDQLPTENISLSSAPLSSPTGQTFAAITGTTLRLYRTATLTMQPPGATDFGTRITLQKFLDNGTLLLYLDGQTQVIVIIDVFINSSGTQGVYTLPFASTEASVSKMIAPGIYATSNKTGSLFNVLIYSTSTGQLLGTVLNLSNEPLDVFFRHSAIPELSHSQPEPSHSRSPTTSYQHISSAFISHQVTVKSSSFSPTSSSQTSAVVPEATPTGSTEKQNNNHATFILVGFVAVVIAFVVAVAVVLIFARKKKTFHYFRLTCTKKRPITCTECGETKSESIALHSYTTGLDKASLSIDSGQPSSRNRTFQSTAAQSEVDSCIELSDGPYPQPIPVSEPA